MELLVTLYEIQSTQYTTQSLNLKLFVNYGITRFHNLQRQALTQFIKLYQYMTDFTFIFFSLHRGKTCNLKIYRL